MQLEPFGPSVKRRLSQLREAEVADLRVFLDQTPCSSRSFMTFVRSLSNPERSAVVPISSAFKTTFAGRGGGVC
ncbi:MAG TPA: hypothetical protein VN256_00575 [Pyrinomonadaceae bacterium]|nr:hypothetical protein [Pyrinomonadaceae bacterium]